MPAALREYVGSMVVLVPALPHAVHQGCALAGVYHGGLLFRNGRGIQLWVSWVDLWAGHCRLEGTADAEAIMAIVAAGAVKVAARAATQLA